MTQEERIKKINEFTKISRERELTETEKTEREKLRREYLDILKGNLELTLNNTSIKYPDGSTQKLKKKD